MLEACDMVVVVVMFDAPDKRVIKILKRQIVEVELLSCWETF